MIKQVKLVNSHYLLKGHHFMACTSPLFQQKVNYNSIDVRCVAKAFIFCKTLPIIFNDSVCY